MSSKFYAIISGAGSGTGRAAALRFARAYPVVVLARSPASYSPIVDDIKAAGGDALGLTADASDPEAVSAAFDSIAREWPHRKLAAAVYNANAGFAFKPFLELTEGDLDAGLGAAAYVSPHLCLRDVSHDVERASSSSPRRQSLYFSNPPLPVRLTLPR